MDATKQACTAASHTHTHTHTLPQAAPSPVVTAVTADATSFRSTKYSHASIIRNAAMTNRQQFSDCTSPSYILRTGSSNRDCRGCSQFLHTNAVTAVPLLSDLFSYYHTVPSAEAKQFSPLQNDQTGSVGHPAWRSKGMRLAAHRKRVEPHLPHVMQQ